MSLNGITIIISFVLIFNIDGRLSDCYLRSLGMTKQQFYFRIFEAALNIIGVLIGSYWGILGVAVSVVLTNSFAKLIKTLFVAMKESGYEWDADKKELKKIEQKPAEWSEEDYDCINAAISNLEYLKNNYPYHKMYHCPFHDDARPSGETLYSVFKCLSKKKQYDQTGLLMKLYNLDTLEEVEAKFQELKRNS